MGWRNACSYDSWYNRASGRLPDHSFNIHNTTVLYYKYLIKPHTHCALYLIFNIGQPLELEASFHKCFVTVEAEFLSFLFEIHSLRRLQKYL